MKIKRIDREIKTKIGNYLELTKPKVTLLNLLVGVSLFCFSSVPYNEPV